MWQYLFWFFVWAALILLITDLNAVPIISEQHKYIAHIKLVTNLFRHCYTLTQPHIDMKNASWKPPSNTKHKRKAWLTSNVTATKLMKNAQRHTNYNLTELSAAPPPQLEEMTWVSISNRSLPVGSMAWPEALAQSGWFPALIQPKVTAPWFHLRAWFLSSVRRMHHFTKT